MIKRYEIGINKLVYSRSKSIFFKAFHKWIKTLKRWINIHTMLQQVPKCGLAKFLTSI